MNRLLILEQSAYQARGIIGAYQSQNIRLQQIIDSTKLAVDRNTIILKAMVAEQQSKLEIQTKEMQRIKVVNNSMQPVTRKPVPTWLKIGERIGYFIGGMWVQAKVIK